MQHSFNVGSMTVPALQPDAPLSDDDLPDTPTPKQVARWLQKSLATVYAWCREGKIPHKRVGRQTVMFDKKTLLAWRQPEE